MPIALAFNPGSASLKFELIELAADQSFASQAKKLASASIEEIGKSAKLLVFKDRGIDRTEECSVSDMAEGTKFAIEWLQKHPDASVSSALEKLDLIGVRVVHGGDKYASATKFSEELRHDIEAFEELAPLHNKNSLAIIDTAKQYLQNVPIIVSFDTAFHCTIPETAWRYPIDRETADCHHVRKYGFHGISHRYMVETYAQSVNKKPGELSLVTLHLESGSSAAAIAKGKSIDTTMGLTPLEGLMMGTRSGSIDPAILPYLMKHENKSADEVLTLLNKKSGLLGIAGETFDTRKLVKRDDDAAKLAMAMFSYRVRLAVGAYLAAVGDAEAVIFGGGIGENTPSVRAEVCAGLKGWGLELDEALNTRSTSGEVHLSTPASRLHAHVIPVEEGLQIAHECWQCLR